MIVKGAIPKGEIDVKRFHLDNVVFESSCPSCREMVMFDLSSGYISYPSVNAPVAIPFYCGECDRDWEEAAMFEVKVRVV